MSASSGNVELEEGASQQPENRAPADHAIIAWLKKRRWEVLIGSVTTAFATGLLIKHTHKHRSRGGISSLDQLSSGEAEGGVRIPLKEVLRFKERQWFLEELETSREGDANSMLRLAKMYLHGQGCAQNVLLASEWLRKARQLGMYATLEELWAGEPDELNRLRAEAGYRGATRRMPSAAAAS